MPTVQSVTPVTTPICVTTWLSDIWNDALLQLRFLGRNALIVVPPVTLNSTTLTEK